MTSLDALESTPEGCVTHHNACPCREERTLAVMRAADRLLDAHRGSWDKEMLALDLTRIAWENMQ